MLSVEATECKPLSERIKNVEANYIMQSGRWILSAYQFSGKWDNENNAVRRNLNAWVRPALRFVHQHKSHLKTYVFQVAFAISAIPAILLRQIRQDIRPQSLLLPQSIEAAVQIHFIDCRKNGAAQQQTLVVERSLRLGGLAAEHHGKTSL